MRPRRKDFCVTWKRNSCRVQCLLVQRRSRHRGYLATKSGVNGILDVGIPRTPSRGIDGAGFKVYQVDCAYIEHARCVGLAQAGDNFIRLDQTALHCRLVQHGGIPEYNWCTEPRDFLVVQ